MPEPRPPTRIRWAQRQAEIDGALHVRRRVFCDEQGVAWAEEHDRLDDVALHLVAVADGERVIGTLRLLVAGPIAKIGRVAVERPWRRRGVASAMLSAALALARERGCAEARLGAQVQAAGLYERAGFSIDSAPFEEAGIAHVWMRRTLLASESPS